jgi:chaperonin GroES
MLTSHIKPLGSRVLVKRAEAQTTKGGILLPDSAKEKPKMGEIVAVGPGKLDESGSYQSMNVQLGDKVLFSTYAGVEVKSNEPGSDYLIINEDDILGVITPNSK